MEVQQQNEIIFEANEKFLKSYSRSWKYLQEEFSPLEFKAAYSLALMAKAHTNSLEPLSDETTYKEISKVLDVSINRVNKVLDKLLEYGVYGKFEVVDPTKSYTKYWILNPYLCFSGRVIKSDIAELFKGTRIGRNFRMLE